MRRGMTLIELLVVIALMSTLAALIFAATNKVRQRAYLGACISNLRQLVTAVHMYENDWGTVPIEAPVVTPEGYFGFVQQTLVPYVQDEAIFFCPADFTGGRCHYSEEYSLNPLTGEIVAIPRPANCEAKTIRWRGREWLTSYDYYVNDLVVAYAGTTRLRPESPLFGCDWHLPHFRGIMKVLARYDGSVEIPPMGRYKEIKALFEGGKNE